jgi:hypothetical protein
MHSSVVMLVAEDVFGWTQTIVMDSVIFWGGYSGPQNSAVNVQGIVSVFLLFLWK